MKPQRLDLGVLFQPVDQNALGAQFVAAMHQRDLRREIGEKERLFDRRVPAADDDDFLPAIEKPVTGGAGRHAKSLELLLAGQAQPLGARAGAKDDGVGHVFGAAVGLADIRTFGEIDRADDVADDFRAHRLCVRLHPDHQVGALNLGIAGPVLDLCRGGQLAARLDPLHQNRLKHGAAGIDGGGIARRAGADDQNLGLLRAGHMRRLSDGIRVCSHIAPEGPMRNPCT